MNIDFNQIIKDSHAHSAISQLVIDEWLIYYGADHV